MSAHYPKRAVVLRLVGLQRNDFNKVVEVRILDKRHSC